MATAAAPSSQASQSQQLGATRTVTPRDDPAVLKLIPLDKDDCQMHLRKQNSSSDSSPSSNVDHRPIILKLSHVLDVETESSCNESKTATAMIHARRFQDGSVAASVLLGRNETTGIKQSSVSRALCDVSFSRGTGKTPDGDNPMDESSLVAHLSMRKSPGQHAVHLDGKIVTEPLGRTIAIGDGSIITLWGQVEYCYLVQIRSEDDTNTTAATANDSEPPNKKQCADNNMSPRKSSAIQVIRKRAHQLMVGESTCALCMDILIKSTFAIPW